MNTVPRVREYDNLLATSVMCEGVTAAVSTDLVGVLTTPAIVFNDEVTLTSENTGSPWTLVLPGDAGNENEFLKSDGVQSFWSPLLLPGDPIVTDDVVETSRHFLSTTAETFTGAKTFTTTMAATDGLATNVVDLEEAGTLTVRQAGVDTCAVDSAGDTHVGTGGSFVANNVTIALPANVTTSNASFAVCNPSSKLVTMDSTRCSAPAGVTIGALTISSSGNFSWANNGKDKFLQMPSGTNPYGIPTTVFRGDGSIRFVAPGFTRIAGGSMFSRNIGNVAFQSNKYFIASAGLGTGGFQFDTSSYMGVEGGTFVLDGFNTLSFAKTSLDQLRMTTAVSIPRAFLMPGISAWSSGSATVTVQFRNYFANTSASPCSLVLPVPTAMAGNRISVLRNDTGSVNALTLDATTNGVTLAKQLVNVTSTTPMQAWTLFTDGVEWFFV